MTTDAAELDQDQEPVITPERRGPVRGPGGRFLPREGGAPGDSAKPRRGRPKGSKNKAQKAPKRAAAKRPPSRWEKIAGAVVMANAGLALFATDDALDEQEIRMLTDALDAECDVYPALERWMTSAARMSPHFMLLQAAFVIALPRLERRGMVPGGASEALGAADSVAAGRTHGGDRPDPEREIYAGEPAAVSLAIPGDTTDEN